MINFNEIVVIEEDQLRFELMSDQNSDMDLSDAFQGMIIAPFDMNASMPFVEGQQNESVSIPARGGSGREASDYFQSSQYMDSEQISPEQ